MKAIVYTEFGPPEVLKLKEVSKPLPKKDEVLIRVYAVAVAKEDPEMRASPGLNGLSKPKKAILGSYLSGEVESVGIDVKRFVKGDQVFGSTFPGAGAYAEYISVPENGVLTGKPDDMTYVEAAAIPNGALTALPFLRDYAKIQRGQSVLINGASGAVGTAAVQLAYAFGAKVSGVCSTTNLELVRSLGADQVIDYTEEDFTQTSQLYDIIFDAVGKSSFSRCKDSLTKKGIYLSTIPLPTDVPRMLWTSIVGGKKVRFGATGMRSARKKAKDLVFIKELAEAGKIQAVIDSVYPLEQIADAHRYVEKGHKKGNVIITIENQ
jgi:NADPH:quinone reductase-like Zn-dependent oxidoreductase